jgi:hypothetical protein
LKFSRSCRRGRRRLPPRCRSADIAHEGAPRLSNENRKEFREPKAQIAHRAGLVDERLSAGTRYCLPGVNGGLTSMRRIFPSGVELRACHHLVADAWHCRNRVMRRGGDEVLTVGVVGAAAVAREM